MSSDTARTRHTLMWLQQVARDRTQPGRAAAVGTVLANYRNRDSWNAWPSVATLADDLGMTRQGVQKVIRAMEGAGHLACEIGGGPGGNNLYRFLLIPQTDVGAPRQTDVGTPGQTDVGSPRQQELPDLPTDVSAPANKRWHKPSDEPLNQPSDEPRDRSRGSRMDPDAVLTEEWIEEAEKPGLSREDAAREFPRFRDYWVAVPGAKGVKVDWPATWRNWCRKAVEWQQPRRSNGRGRISASAIAESGPAIPGGMK